MDPVQGGTPNPYVYPDDPVNDFDLDGTFSFKKAMRYMSYANPLIAYNGLVGGAISVARGKSFGSGYDAGVSASWTAASVVVGGPAVSAAKGVAVKAEVYEGYPRTDSQNVNKPFHLISATVKQS